MKLLQEKYQKWFISFVCLLAIINIIFFQTNFSTIFSFKDFIDVLLVSSVYLTGLFSIIVPILILKEKNNFILKHKFLLTRAFLAINILLFVFWGFIFKGNLVYQFFNTKGNIYFSLKNYPMAINNYQKCSLEDNIVNRLIFSYYQTKNFGKAFELYGNLNDENSEIVLKQIKNFEDKFIKYTIQNSNYAKAVEIIENALKREPDNRKYLLLLADIYTTVAMYEEARNIYKKLLTKYPDDKGIKKKFKLVSSEIDALKSYKNLRKSGQNRKYPYVFDAEERYFKQKVIIKSERVLKSITSTLEDEKTTIGIQDTDKKFSDGLLKFVSCISLKGHLCNNLKFGYFDTNMKIAIPASFDTATQFVESLATVCRYKSSKIRIPGCIIEKGQCGIINTSGKYVVKLNNIQEIRGFSEGLVAFKRNNRWGFLDKTGKIIIKPAFVNVMDFSEGLAAFKNDNDKWGFINKKGQVVIQPQLKSDNPIDFHCPEQEKTSYVNLDNFNTIGYKFTNNNCEVINRIYYINKLGKDIEVPDIIDDNNFEVKEIKGKFGLINKEGKFVIPPRFDLLEYFDNSPLLAACFGNPKLIDDIHIIYNHCGYIDKTGKFVIPPVYKYVWPGFSNDNPYALVQINDKDECAIINKKGKIIFTRICPHEE